MESEGREVMLGTLLEAMFSLQAQPSLPECLFLAARRTERHLLKGFVGESPFLGKSVALRNVTLETPTQPPMAS